MSAPDRRRAPQAPTDASAVVGRDEAKSAAAVAELKDDGASALAITADVTDKAAVAAMVDARLVSTRRAEEHPKLFAGACAPPATVF